MNNTKTKNVTYLAMFIAIEILLVLVPFLGFIPIGPLRATTLHIPVIIASIVLGVKEGCIVGFVFGLFSLINNTINPTITSFAFSPFISGNILSAVIAIVPRVLIGYVSGTVYQLLHEEKKGIVLGSFLGAFTNTILVLGGIFLIFGQSYAQAINVAYKDLLFYFMSIIGTNSLLEAVVGTMICSAVSIPLLKLKK